MIFAAMSEAAEEKGVNVWEARPGWSGAPTATPGTA